MPFAIGDKVFPISKSIFSTLDNSNTWRSMQKLNLDYLFINEIRTVNKIAPEYIMMSRSNGLQMKASCRSSDPGDTVYLCGLDQNDSGDYYLEEDLVSYGSSLTNETLLHRLRRIEEG